MFVFLVSSGKKQISPLLAPPGKILEKSADGLSCKTFSNYHERSLWHWLW